MDTLLRRPWIPLSLLVLAATGVCIRVAEYRTPVIAARLYTEAENLGTAWEREETAREIPDEANAALLYDKAFQLLHIPEVDWDGIYMNGDLITRWKFSEDAYQPVYGRNVVHLPPPPHPFPEWLRAQIDGLLSRNAECLALLYRASTLSQSYWRQPYEPEPGTRRDFWGQSLNMPVLLLYDALAHTLDSDGDGAMNALHALAAYDNARKHIRPPILNMRASFSRQTDALNCILVYGIEGRVFSDHALVALDALLELEPASPVRVLQVYWADMQRWWPEELAFENAHRRDWMRTGPGGAVLWYMERQAVLANLDMVLAGRERQQWLTKAPGAADYLALRKQGQVYSVSSGFELWRSLRDPWGRHKTISLGYLHGLDHYLYYLQNSYTVQRARFRIAAERYQRDTGAFPERPEQLTPRYLPASQTEAFHDGLHRHERTEDGYTLCGDKGEHGMPLYRYKRTEDGYTVQLAWPNGRVSTLCKYPAGS